MLFKKVKISKLFLCSEKYYSVNFTASCSRVESGFVKIAAQSEFVLVIQKIDTIVSYDS